VVASNFASKLDCSSRRDSDRCETRSGSIFLEDKIDVSGLQCRDQGEQERLALVFREASQLAASRRSHRGLHMVNCSIIGIIFMQRRYWHVHQDRFDRTASYDRQDFHRSEMSLSTETRAVVCHLNTTDLWYDFDLQPYETRFG
jgi:hypothetical protein